MEVELGGGWHIVEGTIGAPPVELFVGEQHNAAVERG
jgi:hypothetical protein